MSRSGLEAETIRATDTMPRVLGPVSDSHTVFYRPLTQTRWILPVQERQRIWERLVSYEPQSGCHAFELKLTAGHNWMQFIELSQEDELMLPHYTVVDDGIAFWLLKNPLRIVVTPRSAMEVKKTCSHAVLLVHYWTRLLQWARTSFDGQEGLMPFGFIGTTHLSMRLPPPPKPSTPPVFSALQRIEDQWKQDEEKKKQREARRDAASQHARLDLLKAVTAVAADGTDAVMAAAREWILRAVADSDVLEMPQVKSMASSLVYGFLNIDEKFMDV